MITIGLAALTLLAKAAIEKPAGSSQSGLVWLLASVLSLGFGVYSLWLLRLRDGLITREELSSIEDLQEEHPAQIKFEVAESVVAGVEEAQSVLRTLLYEVQALVAVFILAVVCWAILLR